MKAVTRIIFVDDNNDKFFGEGPYRVLKAVEETGSLHAAAISMGMAYTKAFKLVKNAEQSLGYKLTDRAVGGKDGGGSTITEKGRDWLRRYESYRDACVKENEKLYLKYFGEAQE